MVQLKSLKWIGNWIYWRTGYHLRLSERRLIFCKLANAIVLRMAKKEYNDNEADYIKLKFKCGCGNVITTDLLHISDMRDINKEVNVIKCDKPIICNKCQTAHQIFFHEDIYSSFCEIPTLSDDKSIIYLHEISYEYANGFDNSLIDYITEIVNLQNFIEKKDSIDLYNQSIVNRMALLYIIAIMDAYCGNTFRYYIGQYDLYLNRFANFLYEGRKVEKREVLKRLRKRSFQNLKSTIIPYYKETFGFTIPENDIINDAVEVRNMLVHNSGRCNDGYLLKVDSSYVENVVTEVKSLVNFVFNKVQDVFFYDIVWPNQQRLLNERKA